MKLYLFTEKQLQDLLKMFNEWDLFTPQEKTEIFNAVMKHISPKIFEGQEAERLLEEIDYNKINYKS